MVGGTMEDKTIEPMPAEKRLGLLHEQRQAWRNDLERLRIQSRLASVLEDPQMQQNILVQVERCVKGLKELDLMIEELKKAENGN